MCEEIQRYSHLPFFKKSRNFAGLCAGIYDNAVLVRSAPDYETIGGKFPENKGAYMEYVIHKKTPVFLYLKFIFNYPDLQLINHILTGNKFI